MADRIGRRKVMILRVLNFSLATGAMALTLESGWLFLSVCRFFVGIGVTGLYCLIGERAVRCGEAVIDGGEVGGEFRRRDGADAGHAGSFWVPSR